jgi:hypothetical protein
VVLGRGEIASGASKVQQAIPAEIRVFSCTYISSYAYQFLLEHYFVLFYSLSTCS